MQIEKLEAKIKSENPEGKWKHPSHWIRLKIEKIIDDPSLTTQYDYVNYLEKNVKASNDFYADLGVNENIIINDPKLALYEKNVLNRTACASIHKDKGPVYCIPNATIYINIDGSLEMARKYNVRGDMSVVFDSGHEDAHHIDNQIFNIEKNLVNYLEYVKKEIGIIFNYETINAISDLWMHQEDDDKKMALNNFITKHFELAADYKFGGYVRNLYDKGILEKGDLVEVKENLIAFGGGETHGSSEERYAAFLKGYITKNPLLNEPLIELFKMFKGSYKGQTEYKYSL